MKLARLAWATMAAAALLLAPAAFAQGVVDDGDPVVASASSDSFRRSRATARRRWRIRPSGIRPATPP